MKIDWNKAPGNATHAVKLGDKIKYVWQKRSDDKKRHCGGFSYHDCSDDDATRTDFYMAREGWRIVSARGTFPIVHEAGEVLWSGEGCPRVGVVCERRTHPDEEDGRYEEVKIIAHTSKGFPVWENTDGMFAGISKTQRMGDFTEFRPRKTPEQIAEIAREKEISEMKMTALGYGGSEQNIFSVCERLYEQGYRKQVAP